MYKILNNFDYRQHELAKNGINVEFIIIDDSNIDSNDNFIKSFTELVFWIHYVNGDNSYADSVIKGFNYCDSFGVCDIIIMMDVDHPVNKIPEMIELLKENDVVIGYDLNSNKERLVTKFLCNAFLSLGLNQPTCGFIGFNKKILKNVYYWKAKSKYDIFHVELIKMIKNKGYNIGQIPFYSNATHNYNMKRYIRWLKDFFILCIHNILGYYS